MAISERDFFSILFILEGRRSTRALLNSLIILFYAFSCTKIVFMAFFLGLLIQQAAI